MSQFLLRMTVICKTHLDRTNLKADVELVGSPRKKSTELQLDDASDLIGNLIQVMKDSRKRPYLDFLDPTMTNEDFVTRTGWTKIQFDKLLDYMYLVQMRNTSNSDKISALTTFWIKIKTGLLFSQICTLFNLEPTADLCRYNKPFSFWTAGETLVPEYLGVGSISRDEAMAHGTIYAETLFACDRVITIWDGSYFYIQKIMKWPERHTQVTKTASYWNLCL